MTPKAIRSVSFGHAGADHARACCSCDIALTPLCGGLCRLCRIRPKCARIPLGGRVISPRPAGRLVPAWQGLTALPEWAGSADPGVGNPGQPVPEGDGRDDVLVRRAVGLVAGRLDVARDDRVLGDAD